MTPLTRYEQTTVHDQSITIPRSNMTINGKEYNTTKSDMRHTTTTINEYIK